MSLKRKYAPVLLVLVLAVLLSACLGPNQPPTGGGGGEVVIPTTTKVAGAATRDALTAYDPDSGVMRFSTRTPDLAALEPDDVLASEPSPAAPAGYLRKVKSMRTEGEEVILETVQANLTDAIHQGTLDGSGELTAKDLVGTTALVEGLSIGPAVGVGDGYQFRVGFDEMVLDLNEHDIKMQVRVSGELYFNAGYHVGVGISGCLDVPPVCVDSFDATIGFDQHAELHVDGEASARLAKEIKVAELYFSPACFFIGPVPVCVVPSVFVFVGASGEVNLKFSYGAKQTAQALVGARWTDDNGWENINTGPTFDTSFAQNFDINAGVKASTYLKSEGSLLLYGVTGPMIGAKLGLELDAAIPRDPFWILRGSLEAYYGFIVQLPVVGRLDESHGNIFTVSKEFGSSDNATPIIAIREPNLRVDHGTAVEFTFFRDGWGCVTYHGLFCVYDPEDGVPSYTVTSDKDGQLPKGKYTFLTPGLRVITISATDSKGATATATFQVDVVNTPPTAYGSAGSDTVQQTVPFFVSAAASDPNSKLDCSNLAWSVVAPDTVESLNISADVCYGRAIFNVLGDRTITLTATDPEGAVSSPRTFFVYVTSPPPNSPPTITQPLSVVGCSYDDCFEVPENGIVYNLYVKLSVAATDPDGVTYNFTAQCFDCADASLNTRQDIGTNDTGVLEYYPPRYAYGTWRFGVNVTDGSSTISFGRTITFKDPGPR